MGHPAIPRRGPGIGEYSEHAERPHAERIELREVLTREMVPRVHVAFEEGVEELEHVTGVGDRQTAYGTITPPRPASSPFKVFLHPRSNVHFASMSTRRLPVID